MRLVRTCLAAVLAIGALAVSASAAQAENWRPVPTSCLRATALAGCTTLTNGSGIWNVAVAPGGQTAYATAFTADKVLIFDRNTVTGALTQRAGAAGCVSEGAVTGCLTARGLHQPDGIVVSADGRSVYVASWNANSDGVANGVLAVFTRNPSTGALGYVKCFSSNGASNGVAGQCTVGRGLTGARDVELSPDQQTVYAGPSGSIATFSRNTSDGSLTQPLGSAGCIATTVANGCAGAPAIGTGGRQFTVSPDGQSVYVVGNTAPSSLAILDRNDGEVNHGVLSQEPGTQSCFSATALTGGQCTLEPKLAGAAAALTSGDGRQVYVSTTAGVLTFARGSDGLLTLQSCINDLGNSGCAGGKTLTGLTYMALSADGEDLVADVNTGVAGVVMLSRNPSGNLSQRTGTNEVCVTATGAAFDNNLMVAGGCTASSALSANGHVTFGDANSFYAGTQTGNALVTIKRDYAPICPDQSIAVTRDSSIPVAFGCTDRNGDAMSYSIIEAPLAGNLGAIDQPGERVFYNPFGGFVGADAFRYRAFASPQSSNIATASLTVVAPPESPGGGVVLPTGIDADKDGFFAGQDCNDNNAAIRPGAQEVKGNFLDENCDGVAEPFPTLTSGVASKWGVKGTAFTLTSLQVTQQFPKGWKAKILCTGSKCPFKSKTLKAGKVSKGASTVITSLSKKQRKFRAGQTVEVWVSAPSFNTKVARLLLKKGKIPTTQPFCVLPGETKPRKSCS
jgi:hypothetical protein